MIHLSGGIGGGCTGGFLFLCFVIYMLHRLLRPATRTHPGNPSDIVIRVKHEGCENQNGAGADTLFPRYSAFSESCSVEPVSFLLERNDMCSHFLLQRKFLCWYDINLALVGFWNLCNPSIRTNEFSLRSDCTIIKWYMRSLRIYAHPQYLNYLSPIALTKG